MKRFLSLCGLVSAAVMQSQQPAGEYQDYVRQADSLYAAQDFTAASVAYTAAFKANHWKAFPKDRYSAARCWALIGIPDSAFFHLNRIATRSAYSEYDRLVLDADLESLREDPRWQPLLEKIKQNKAKAEAGLDMALVHILDSVNYHDQKPRLKLEALEKKYAWTSKEVRDQWAYIRRTDSLNVLKVTSILDQYGWLGPEVIGPRGNATLFVVMQHADVQTQAKYLPMMREAVKNGKAYASSLALVEDRVALAEGRRQVYGTQIGSDVKTKSRFVLPLEDPDHVDARRKDAGLPTMAVYVKKWNIAWDVEKYKKDLPALEEKLKAQKK